MISSKYILINPSYFNSPTAHYKKKLISLHWEYLENYFGIFSCEEHIEYSVAQKYPIYIPFNWTKIGTELNEETENARCFFYHFWHTFVLLVRCSIFYSVVLNTLGSIAFLYVSFILCFAARGSHPRKSSEYQVENLATVQGFFLKKRYISISLSVTTIRSTSFFLNPLAASYFLLLYLLLSLTLVCGAVLDALHGTVYFT